MPSPLRRRVRGKGARPMLQRPQYRRGGPNIVRSPAPGQCRCAASIVIHTRAALSYTRAQPKSYSQRRRAAHSPVAQPHSPRRGMPHVTSYVRLSRLRVPLRGESCVDSTSILEAARVELQRVLSRYKVPSPQRRRVCGKGTRPKPLRPQCRRGGPNIARSPASIVCRRGALIIL